MTVTEYRIEFRKVECYPQYSADMFAFGGLGRHRVDSSLRIPSRW